MKLFTGLSETARILCRMVCMLCALFLALGLLVIRTLYAFEQPRPFATGLLFGCLFSVLKVALMEQSLERSFDMESGARSYAGLMSILRYFLTIGALLLGVFVPRVFGIFGMVLGIVALHPAAYLTNAALRRRPGYGDADAPSRPLESDGAEAAGTEPCELPDEYYPSEGVWSALRAELGNDPAEAELKE